MRTAAWEGRAQWSARVHDGRSAKTHCRANSLQRFMNSASSLSATYILPVFMRAACMRPQVDIALTARATCIYGKGLPLHGSALAASKAERVACLGSVSSEVNNALYVADFLF